MYNGQYDESKDHLDNDGESSELFEIQQCHDFYWMVTVYYKENPVTVFRACQGNECESFSELSDSTVLEI